MKLSKLAVVAAASAASVGAFSFSAGVQRCRRSSRMVPVAAGAVSTALRMSDDDDFAFPSAMPVKPQQTMKEKLEDSATQFIADLTARLGDGVAPPPEMEALRQARDADSDESVLALRIYELMIGE